ncbi:MAG: hypothetical protein KR126chlam1_00377 [Chlamydiae bacterium]|nr:hypothetical protein [Chlamydiota bacterium]
MRKNLKLLGFALAIFAVAHFAQRQTDGFTLQKISRSLLQEETTTQVDVPNMRYHYLTKGGQSYVFLSEDGEYVLKLFRDSKRQNLSLLHRLLPLKIFETKLKKLEEEQRETLKSYQLAFERLKRETALHSIHLNTGLPTIQALRIVDKLGIEHTIDGNLYPFILQKKAKSVKEHIEELMQKGHHDHARVALEKLAALIKGRIAAKIHDGDPNLSKNFGFLGGRPVQIDAGRFSMSRPAKRQRLKSSKEDLQNWINEHHPQLSEAFDEAFQPLLKAL